MTMAASPGSLTSAPVTRRRPASFKVALRLSMTKFCVAPAATANVPPMDRSASAAWLIVTRAAIAFVVGSAVNAFSRSRASGVATAASARCATGAPAADWAPSTLKAAARPKAPSRRRPAMRAAT